MSMPSCEKMPVLGAMKPMRRSDACADALNETPVSSALPKSTSSLDVHGLSRFMIAPSVRPMPILLGATARGLVAACIRGDGIIGTSPAEVCLRLVRR
jgi:hypothetical protein